MKKCKDCKKNKKVENFYPAQGECKDCTRKRVKNNRLKNKEYYDRYDQRRNREDYNLICLRKYSMMKQRVLGRSSHWSIVEGKEIMSKGDFLNWCQKNKSSFKKIQRIWRDSGYKRKFAPSIDRVDNQKSYVNGNLQWLPLYKNVKKDNLGREWAQKKRNSKGQWIN